MAGVNPESKRELLDIISEIRTRIEEKMPGGMKFPMPKFIVIGGQSAGKSRLLEAIAGEQFNHTSGSLGSRRPTVMEFRNLKAGGTPQWYYENEKKSAQEVQEIVKRKHTELGHATSKEAIHVRLESPDTVDLQIVDLPGYRSFSATEADNVLAQSIVDLNQTYLEDKWAQILCVEPAGDPSTYGNLARVKKVDPTFARTWLVRTKLDRWYGDLTASTVNVWLAGGSDLPDNLNAFALSLPFWPDDAPRPKAMKDMRQDCDLRDLQKVREAGANAEKLKCVGFVNFNATLDAKTSEMFVAAIYPVLSDLTGLKEKLRNQGKEFEEALENLDPRQTLTVVRTCGKSFANCLAHVMEGYIASTVNKMSLDQELREFNKYYKRQHPPTDPAKPDIDLVPHSMFQNQDAYIEHLSKVNMCKKNEKLNGGAQFRRLMSEVEMFLRFSDLSDVLNEHDRLQGDMLQAFGVGVTEVTWKDVIQKLLNEYGKNQLERRVMYVGERLKWFFEQQKEPIVEFMEKISTAPNAKNYSRDYKKSADRLRTPVNRTLVFAKYDEVCADQLQKFIALFTDTLYATFSNPLQSPSNTTKDITAEWISEMTEVLLIPDLSYDEYHKKGYLERLQQERRNAGSINGGTSLTESDMWKPVVKDKNGQEIPIRDGEDLDTACKIFTAEAFQAKFPISVFVKAPLEYSTLPQAKARVEDEKKQMASLESKVTKKIYDIPTAPHKIDRAVDQIQQLLLQVFARIRSQLCDQVELFAESFFKMPLMRRLEDSMQQIMLTEAQEKSNEQYRQQMSDKFIANQAVQKDVGECLTKLNRFAQEYRGGRAATAKDTGKRGGYDLPGEAKPMGKGDGYGYLPVIAEKKEEAAPSLPAPAPAPAPVSAPAPAPAPVPPAPTPAPYHAGQKIGYYSDGQKDWFDGTVVSSNADGSITVNVPGPGERTVPAAKVPTHLRPSPPST